MANLALRDFVYLDIDRVQSILAQMDRGLINEITSNRKESEEIEGGVEAGFWDFIRSHITGKYALEKDTGETRTLHDYIYTIAEESLKKTDLINQISDEEQYKCNIGKLSETSFILLHSHVQIEDSNQIIQFVKHANDVFNAINELAKSSGKGKANVQMPKIPPKVLSGVLSYFEMTYKNRISIRSIPIPDLKIQFIGILNEKYLRDSIANIIFKYGTRPNSKWFILGQVCAIPNLAKSKTLPVFPSKDPLHEVYEGLRELESSTFQTVQEPDISFTPIAIYRQ